MNFRGLLGNIRFYILVSTVLISVGVYFYVNLTVAGESQRIVKLTEYYALISVTYLYITLLATPLTRFFNNLPYRGQYIKSRRALGVSAFYFGLIHGSIAFFLQLGGFEGLFFLSDKYLLAIGLSASALLILTLMALTAFDFIVDKLSFAKWKMLHRFVYLAGIFIVIHALMLGSHFADLSGLIPQIFYAALAFLLVLEAIRVDRYLQNKFINLPQFGVASVLIIGIVIASLIYLLAPVSSNGAVSLGIHAAHIQLAKEAQQGGASGSVSTNPALASIPGLQGDRTRRFTVTFDRPEVIYPNQDTKLSFEVFDASSGNKINLFSRVYEKVLHLIVVDSQLNYFNHIHPDQTDKDFEITTQFPAAGQYHLYLDFQPLGAIEQQFAFTVNVGDVEAPTLSDALPDTNLTKVFDKYEVTLSYPSPLKASEMSIGNQKLTFTINDAVTKQPITNLKPYLAAFGHLVMINEKTFDYLHVHPNNLVAPAANANGGPVVEFLPLGIYGPIKPGIYRVFAQFNPDNNLFTSNFTVKIE